MFCFQCQETAKNTGCTVKGVCGKPEETANLQDLLIFTLKRQLTKTRKFFHPYSRGNMDIQTKRVYDPVDMKDGVRVLVDRVWPRGLSKERVQAVQWLKDAAPGAALRKWFAHDRAKWNEFRKRYVSELNTKPEVVEQLLELAAKERLTLLFSARDTQYNQAVALKEYLISVARRGGASAGHTAEKLNRFPK